MRACSFILPAAASYLSRDPSAAATTPVARDPCTLGSKLTCRGPCGAATQSGRPFSNALRAALKASRSDFARASSKRSHSCPD